MTCIIRRCIPGLSALLLAVGCEEKPDAPPPRTVPHVDLSRYLGTWYEVARFPNRFQKGCFRSTASYSMRPDGDIDVVNRCRKDSVDGPEDVAEGKAWVEDPVTNAKLKVRFFWPFSGDYWVLELAPDYGWVVVGEPSRKYLWVLARRLPLPAATWEEIAERISRQGYNPGELIREPAAVESPFTE